MEKRKERSSRHRMKIDSGREGAEEDGTLLLANPMAGGEVSPHSVTSALPQEHQQPKAPLVVGKKSRPKSPSLLRFFVRGGGNRKASEEEETVDSAGSDHEDPFSPHGGQSHCTQPEQMSSESPIRFNRNLEAYITMPRRRRRVEKRDSGFHSERSESMSQDKEQLSVSPEDMRLSPLPMEEKPVGMEALEALHNQIQILVKQDCPEEETQVTSLHDAVIASLRQQLEDTQQSLDILRQSDHNLRLALRDAEQRTLEAEKKLKKSTERNQWLEQKLLAMAQKYRQLQQPMQEGSRTAQQVVLPVKHVTSSKAMYYSPQVQRTQRDSECRSLDSVGKRPSSAQDTRDSSTSMETRV